MIERRRYVFAEIFLLKCWDVDVWGWLCSGLSAEWGCVRQDRHCAVTLGTPESLTIISSLVVTVQCELVWLVNTLYQPSPASTSCQRPVSSGGLMQWPETPPDTDQWPPVISLTVNMSKETEGGGAGGGGSEAVKHQVPDTAAGQQAQYVGPYRLEKTLGKGQTGRYNITQHCSFYWWWQSHRHHQLNSSSVHTSYIKVSQVRQNVTSTHCHSLYKHFCSESNTLQLLCDHGWKAEASCFFSIHLFSWKSVWLLNSKWSFHLNQQPWLRWIEHNNSLFIRPSHQHRESPIIETIKCLSSWQYSCMLKQKHRLLHFSSQFQDILT